MSLDDVDLCKECDTSLPSAPLPHVHVLGELPVSHPDDSGANGASYGDYLRWLAAEHVVVGGKRLAVVAPKIADEVIREFRRIEFQRKTEETRQRGG